MRHLLTTILVVALASIIFANCPNSIKASDTFSEAAVETAVEAAEEENEEEEEEEEEEENIEPRYYGDTLYQYDGKTIVYNYLFEWEESEWEKQSTALSTNAIITYRDTTPIDTCRVIGDRIWIVNGDSIDFAIGVDTISYALRNLPDSMDPERKLVSAKFDFRRHEFNHSFEPTDSTRTCNFSFVAYLPKGHQKWVEQFIATVMRNDIQAIFLCNKGSDRILNEYYGIKKKPKKINGINAYTMTPEQIAEHFANDFETHYREEFSSEDCDRLGLKYDYMLTVAPAWMSSDKSLVTYRFYSYYYTSGMHGFMEEYYLTFDSDNGRLLGRDDLFTTAGFKSAIGILEQKLCDHRNTFTTCNGPYPAYLEEAELEANASEIIKEIKDGIYYPRPALTNNGVIFSYQPYEVAPFSEGILHFPIPYKQLSLKVKR